MPCWRCAQRYEHVWNSGQGAIISRLSTLTLPPTLSASIPSLSSPFSPFPPLSHLQAVHELSDSIP